MTTFTVTAGTLTTFAGVLSSGGHSLDIARSFSTTANSYVNTYVPVPHDPGDLYSEIYKNNQQVVQILDAATRQVGELLRLSAAELVKSGNHYVATDAENAATVDASYPTGQHTPPVLNEGVNTSGGLADPDTAIAGVPSSSTLVPDMVHWIIDKAGWVSISGVALKIASLFGLDPVAELTKAVVGDYGELAQAGNAVKALADFEQIAAGTIASGAAAMEWAGNAADDAMTFFNSVVNALVEHAGALDELHRKYSLLAEHCSELAQVLGSLLTTAIDNILICVAELAAAGCLASVPGINVLIGIIGAYQVWKTSQAVAAFLRVTGWVFYGVEGLLAACTGLASAAQKADVNAIFPSAPFSNDIL